VKTAYLLLNIPFYVDNLVNVYFWFNQVGQVM